jgi:hypothetical protein
MHGDCPTDQPGSTERDPAEYTEASHCPDMAHELDKAIDHVRQIILDCAGNNEAIAQHVMAWHSNSVMAEALAMAAGMLNHIVDSKQTLPSWGLKFAANLHGAQGKTMTHVAKRLKVTKAAVSKAANKWADDLRLPRSAYMKSEQARKSYSDERKRHHWRHEHATHPR